ncbi:uncharacterized protein C10orf95 homolog [Taeniopygia guttata]|uniref:uncharacterized protein C10orf95 homolog n=1 Tax=Taeniopygia guttata TaxID=59729 RepID=UPI0002B4A6D4|nr:uncharacterized protein C10orf95 homolog [Taeniopygia guttata]XP_030132166.1 uncharacterized protein C10orf95 homolog [Taeniopygia guttata]XP_030132167.1 uncharacterized protein C10orf95 homolog [Taeniopygia guttata]
MYQSSFMPREYYPAMIPPSAYTYPPLRPGRAEDMSRPVMFPPIHMPNFYSRPITFVVDRNSYPDYAGGQVEYHHLYSASNPYIYPYHTWHFPPMVPIPLYNPYANYHPYATCQRSDQYRDTWPEGFTMRGELQWGKLGKVFGPRKDLPEFVKDDLRRVYGTYPRTNVSISYRKGEFLVKGDPKIEDQEYAVEKKVIQQAVTPSASEADDSSEDRNRKKKKKLRH